MQMPLLAVKYLAHPKHVAPSSAQGFLKTAKAAGGQGPIQKEPDRREEIGQIEASRNPARANAPQIKFL